MINSQTNNNKFWSIFILASAFFAMLMADAAAQTDKPLQCRFTVICDEGAVRLRLQSEERPCSDEAFTLRIEKGSVTKILPAPPMLVPPIPADLTTRQSGVCRAEGGGRVTAYRVSAGRILLFLLKSGRPSTDRVQALLIDTNRLALLDAKELGGTKNGDALAVVPAPGGFRLRIIRSSSPPGLVCDCDAGEIEAWMAVRVREDRISTRWLPS